MNWRRILDVLARRPSPPNDERSLRSVELARLRKNVNSLSSEARQTKQTVHAVSTAARLGSYQRVRLPR